jgi:hypothetical protein
LERMLRFYYLGGFEMRVEYVPGCCIAGAVHMMSGYFFVNSWRWMCSHQASAPSACRLRACRCHGQRSVAHGYYCEWSKPPSRHQHSLCLSSG